MITERCLRFLPAPMLLVVLCTGGCGSGKRETGIFRGKVELGEEKVAGLVKFVAPDGASGVGPIYTDGTYEVLDAPVGPCKVAIITEHLRKPKANIPQAPGVGGSSGPPDVDMTKKPEGVQSPPVTAKVPALTYIAFPARYEDPQTSNLTFDVQKGEQTFNITLKSE